MECDFCGKKPTFGHRVSHSKRRTNRAWLPNVHKTTLLVSGIKLRFNLCTRCLRTQAKSSV